MGARQDKGWAVLPPGVPEGELTVFTDGMELCSYDLDGTVLSAGKRLKLHHVLSRHGDGVLDLPNEVLRALQNRRVSIPMDRQRDQAGGEQTCIYSVEFCSPSPLTLSPRYLQPASRTLPTSPAPLLRPASRLCRPTTPPGTRQMV